jgi:hypothetical protein
VPTYPARRHHRSAPVRRLLDLRDAIYAHLGGLDNISSLELFSADRLAQMVLLAEMDEARFAKRNYQGLSHEARTEYLRTVHFLLLTSKTLGLQRRSRDVTPSLSEYLADKAEQAEDADIVTEAAE